MIGSKAITQAISLVNQTTVGSQDLKFMVCISLEHPLLSLEIVRSDFIILLVTIQKHR